MATDVNAHEHPRPWRELLGLVAGSESVLVATGQYRSADSLRVGLFCLPAGDGADIELAADEWLTPNGHEDLRTALAATCTVRTGEWDVMYATAWQCAWTADTRDFVLLGNQGKLAWLEGQSLHLPNGVMLDRSTIEHVHAYLGPDWIVRGVAVVDTRGVRYVITEQEDAIARLDPTYDAMSVFLEAAWAVSLATALAAALGIPMRKDTPL